MKGLELEATIRPVDGLSFDGSFSYLDFEYTTPTSGGFLVGSAIPGSAITPYTPKTSWSVGAQYDYQTEVGGFSLRLDGSYQGKLYTTSENTSWSKIPGRFIGNGQISFTSMDKDWKFTFEVKNLFNEYYFQSISDATTSLGIVSGVPGLPRTWSVNVKRTF